MSIGTAAARFMMANPIMKPNERDDLETPRTTGPLGDLVDDKLNKPLTEQIAEELEQGRAGPVRSGTTDYAHGTTEHEDDRET
jgi:hypothetical protein